MLKLAIDEDLDNRILHGLLLRIPDLDVLRVQDAGLAGSPDPVILQWAADQGRVLVTRDKRTMTAFAYERVAAGQPMPGVFAVTPNVRLGQVIDDLALILELTSHEEWAGLVAYLPL